MPGLVAAVVAVAAWDLYALAAKKETVSSAIRRTFPPGARRLLLEVANVHLEDRRD